MEQTKSKTLWWITLGIVIGFGLATLIFSTVRYDPSSRSTTPQNAPSPSLQEKTVATPLPPTTTTTSQPGSETTTLKYAASVEFQVKIPGNLPPTPTTAPTTKPSRVRTNLDMERAIRRQILLVRSDRVLDSVLKDSDAFTHFLEANPVLPKTVLKKRLKVAPIPQTDVFQMTLRGDDPEEVARQVNAIADTYYKVLLQIETDEYNAQMAIIQDTQKTLEKNIQELSKGLEEFNSSHDLKAITQAYQVKMSTFNNLTTALIKAQTEVTAAQTNLETVKKQVKAGTLQLPKETEQAIENDPSLQALEKAKLQLEQELADNVLKFGREHRSSVAIQTRVDETQKQINEMHTDKRDKARILTQENAQTILNMAQDKEKDLSARRDNLEREVKDLDKWLVEYKSRTAHLESQQKLLGNLTRQATLKQLTDHSKVQQVVRLSATTQPSK